MRRRDVFKVGLGAVLAAAGLSACDWNGGLVSHVLPAADHRRFRIKVGLIARQARPPVLHVAGEAFEGLRTDSNGRFWQFDVGGLDPATEYRLGLTCDTGDLACDTWPLRTMPAPDATPERLRILAYTCAGGVDDQSGLIYRSLAERQRLLARAMTFAPDVVVANGDHVYWDQRGQFGPLFRIVQAMFAGPNFDRNLPVMGTRNEDVLIRAFGPQIGGLYGPTFRSTPVFFFQDDHDYTENDEATRSEQTFPADEFMIDVAQSTQLLYYPELLADQHLPSSLLNADDEITPVSRNFGSLRYGRLFEALLFDCRRYFSTSEGGEAGSFIPPDAEEWITRRLAESDVSHLAQMPSTPVLWTAGKWGEWYPDYVGPDGSLGVEVPKPFWEQGWLDQHERLMSAAVAQETRRALVISGDLHASGAGQMFTTSTVDATANPIVSFLVGALGTGPFGFPSVFRGASPQPSATVQAEEWQRPIEENGFSIIDVTPDRLSVSMFKWRPEDGAAAIDTLEPFAVFDVPAGRPVGA